MKPVTEIVEKLVSEIQGAAGIRVKVGWISPGDSVPLITLLMHDSELSPIGMDESKVLYHLKFQLDIWHSSAKARDEAFDNIVEHFESNRRIFHENYGWFDVKFAGVTDLEEEGVYRKLALLRIRVVG